MVKFSLNRSEIFFLIVLLAFFFLGGYFRLNELSITTDSTRYVIWGTSISNGKGFVDFTTPIPSTYVPNAPLYALILAPLMFFFPMSILASKILSLVGGAIALILLFFWLRSHFSSFVSMLGTVALAVYPMFFVFATEALSEIFFIVLTLFILIRFDRYLEGENENQHSSILLVSLGIVYLLREIGIAILCASFITLLFFRHYRIFWKILFISSTLIFIWTMRNFLMADPGVDVAGSSKLQHFIGSYVSMPGNALIQEYVSRLFLNAKGYFIEISGLLLYPFPHFLIVDSSNTFSVISHSVSISKYFVFLGFLLIFLHGISLDISMSRAGLLRTLYTLFYILILLFYPVYDVRFFLPLLPLLLFFSLRSLQWIVRELEFSKTLFTRFGFMAIGILLVFPNLLANYEVISTNVSYKRDPIGFYHSKKNVGNKSDFFIQPWNLMGEWISRNLPEGVIVASPSKDISIFADGGKVLELSRAAPTSQFDMMLRDFSVGYLITKQLWEDYDTYEFQMSESKRFFFRQIMSLSGLKLYEVGSVLGSSNKDEIFVEKKKDTESSSGLLRTGREALLNLNYYEAVGAFSYAQQLDPLQPEITYQLLIGYTLIGDRINAQRAFERLYTLPKADPYILLAPLFLKAMEQLRYASETENQFERSALVLAAARMYGDLGYHKLAYRVVSNLTRIDPNNFDAHLWASYYGKTSGDTSRSYDHLNKLKEIDSTAEILIPLMRIREDEAKLKQSQAPNELASIHFSLAKEFSNLELFESAIDELDRASFLNPSNLEIRDFLYEVLQRKKSALLRK